MAEFYPRYSYVYLMGDYDRNHLPGENDLDAFDTLTEAQRELEMVAEENNLPESHYALVQSYVSPWMAIS
jgi:hypothetical protein